MSDVKIELSENSAELNKYRFLLFIVVVVVIAAKIEVVKCPKDPREWRQVFEIYPVGINEKVLVDLEMMCQCDCEKPGHRVRISAFELRTCP